MNIYQAAKAVAEGRAEDARRKKSSWTLRDIYNDEVGAEEDDLTATDWELIGEKPRTERVEVRVWGVLDPPFKPGEQPRLGATLYPNRDEAFERLVRQCSGRQAVEIVYFYDRPIPKEVTEVVREVVPGVYSPCEESGEVKDLPAAWSGKKVRVEVIDP